VGLHRCPECGQRWICLTKECEDEGVDLICPICTARKDDCHPFTRVHYPGAFKAWVASESLYDCSE